MILTQNKTREYYSTGSREDIVISNSFLNALDPTMGGSPQKAISFFEKQDELAESKYIENGKIVHRYAENAEQFGISEVPRPSESMGELCDEFYKLCFVTQTFNMGTSTEITSLGKNEKTRNTEILETLKAYDALAAALEFDEASKQRLVLYLRSAWSNTGTYKTYKEATVINTMFNKGGIEYIKDLHKLHNKERITLQQKEQIEAAIKSMREHELVNRWFALGGLSDPNIVLKEWDLYFLAKTAKGTTLKAKAKIDCIYIDFENKTIWIIDLKTTSRPLGTFPELLIDKGYHRQLAFYKLAVSTKVNLLNLLPEEYNHLAESLLEFKIRTAIVGSELGQYSACRVFDLQNVMGPAWAEMEARVERASWHITKNEWKKFPEEDLTGMISVKYPLTVNYV